MRRSEDLEDVLRASPADAMGTFGAMASDIRSPSWRFREGFVQAAIEGCALRTPQPRMQQQRVCVQRTISYLQVILFVTGFVHKATTQRAALMS